MIMKIRLLLLTFGYLGMTPGCKDGGIPAEKVADMLHSVIESAARFIRSMLSERMQAKGAAVASENWRSEAPPLPAQFLQESARLGQSKGQRLAISSSVSGPSTSRTGRNPTLSKGV